MYSDENPPSLSDQKRKIEALGTFSSIRWLPDISEIGVLLEPPVEKSDWFKAHSAALTEDVVIIHVRRGDYLNLPSIYNTVHPAYYSAALQYMKSFRPALNTWLFSDDNEAAYAWISMLVHINRVVDTPKDIPPGEVLTLMSDAQQLITANSTFSWWAAAAGLAKNPNISVTIPSKYSNQDDFDTVSNLRFPSWKVLPADGCDL
jgi:hypothetical protein